MGMMVNNGLKGDNQPASQPGSHEKSPALNESKRRLAVVIALGYDLQTARELSFDLLTSDIFEGNGSNLRAVLSGEMRFTEQSALIDDRIAIPLIFSPWQIHGQWLVDGAVSNPLPVDVAIKEGAEIIAAMGFELPARRRMRSNTAVTAHFNSLYMNNILKSRYAFYNAVHHAEIIPILPEFDHPVGTFDINQIPHIIEAGAQAASKQVPYLQRLLSAQ
jgi:hypothetical protein